MPALDEHRQAVGEVVQTDLLEPPFSFFDFVEDNFGDYDSIRRVFYLARSFKAKALILEKIQPCGIIAEENEDILSLFPDYLNPDLIRLLKSGGCFIVSRTSSIRLVPRLRYEVFSREYYPKETLPIDK